MALRTPTVETHAFQISLPQEILSRVLSELRPNQHRQRSRKQTHITIELELRNNASAFRVTKLASHILPVSVEVPLGTNTHDHITKLALAQFDRLYSHTSAHNEPQQKLKDLLKNLSGASSKLTAISSHSIAEELSVAFAPILSRPTHIHPLEIEISDIIQYDELVTLTSTISPPNPAIGSSPPITFIPASRPQVEVHNNIATVSAAFRITGELPPLNTLRFFLHWGRRDILQTPWRDELAQTIHHPHTNSIEVFHSINVPRAGKYAATFFVLVDGNPHPHWIGEYQEDDIAFQIFYESEQLTLVNAANASRQASNLRQIQRALSGKGYLPQVLARIKNRQPDCPLGKLLSDALLEMQDQPKVTNALKQLSNASPLTTQVINNFGIGEIVFISPEGPHAQAGGLGQVAAGLLPALAESGLPVTLLSPLYARQHGNKHQDASQTLQQGISIGDVVLYPKYRGEVTVCMPPSYSTNDKRMIRYPTAITVHLYEAFHASVRLLLLYNPSVFDALYSAVEANEQARRSIIFCRACLETISGTTIHITPSIVISNDWYTAAIPAIARLDERYRSASALRNTKFIHMIHNAGRSYHGIFPTHFNNEDLWSYFNLTGEHYFGFCDPLDESSINFTRGGILHSDAVTTVSPDYATQLMRGEEAPEFAPTLKLKEFQIAGISNGIATHYVRSAATEHRMFQDLIFSENTFSNVLDLLEAKENAKSSIQQNLHLEHRSDAVIITFTGRLAEQKGLSLLYEPRPSSNCSILEELLHYEPRLQIIIAGPPTSNDCICVRFLTHISYLRHQYPGRVASIIEFVPHNFALSVLFAADLSLMPSRFEPGGISQLESLALGTPVVARNIGGLRSTLRNFSRSEQIGNSFLCNEHSTEAYGNTLWWAVQTIQDDQARATVLLNAIKSRNDWEDRVDAYRMLFQELCLSEDTKALLEFLKGTPATSLEH